MKNSLSKKMSLFLARAAMSTSLTPEEARLAARCLSGSNSN